MDSGNNARDGRIQLRDRKPGHRPGFFFALLLALVLVVAGCDVPVPVAPAAPKARPAKLVVAGRLQEKDIDEASGMAASVRSDELLWVVNDSGDKARLYAIDVEGRKRGRIKLDGVSNRDWEDLASFVLDGQPYLLVADIGDNENKHDHVSLYAILEPDLTDDDKHTLEPEWIVRFRYPEGARDAEAIAVDSVRNRVIVISKRDLPASIYEVPLRPVDDSSVEARKLGSLRSLPQPKKEDVRFAPMSRDWHWQPTAMDIARNDRVLIVMTYGAIYLYDRQPENDWPDRLTRPPLVFSLKNIRNAEAAALSANGESIFVTVEQKHAPLLRIDIGPAE
jgi:hypothetical protein